MCNVYCVLMCVESFVVCVVPLCACEHVYVCTSENVCASENVCVHV